MTELFMYALIIVGAYTIGTKSADYIVNRWLRGWIGRKCDDGGQWLLRKAKERKSR